MLICNRGYGKTIEYHFCNKDYFTTLLVINEILMPNKVLSLYSNLHALSQIIKNLLDIIRGASHDTQDDVYDNHCFVQCKV